MEIAWIDRLADGATLPDKERQRLEDLICRRRTFEAGQVVVFENEGAPLLYIIERGWAAAVRELVDGSTQLLDLFLPPQVMGLREIASSAAVSSYQALTELDVAVCRKADMQALIDDSSTLAAPLFRLVAREEAWLHERITLLGQQDAASSLLHLFLELSDRLAVGTDAPTISEFDLPLSQEQIGNLVGITSVHVSRTLTELAKEGLVKVEGNKVRFLDRPRCQERAEYESSRMRIPPS